jgi:hypothetical protein
MLEFTLLAGNDVNYNIINQVLARRSIASFEPVEAISEVQGWITLAYSTAPDVGVNPINGNLLLRSP